MVNTDRPVCSLADLAHLAAGALIPPGAARDEAFKDYKRDLLRLRIRGKLQLGQLPQGDAPETQMIAQASALSWWHSVLKHVTPPEQISEIVKPKPASDPRGDYALEELAQFARFSGGTLDAIKQKINDDAHRGVFRMATHNLSGAFFTGSKVTREVAFVWLKQQGCEIPVELRDLETENVTT